MARVIENHGSRIRNAEPSEPPRASREALNSHYGQLINRLNAAGFGPAGPNKILGLTSTLRGEGVTTVACNLALHAAALRAARVLLVDANPIHSSLHEIFNLPPEPGLLEFLAGEHATLKDSLTDMASKPVQDWPANLRQSLRRDKRFSRWFSTRREDIPTPKISVMPLGNFGNAFRAATIYPARDAIAHAAESFDLVIVDLPTSDALASCGLPISWLDGMLLVLRAEQTSDIAARKSLQRIRDNNGNVLGVVFNQCRKHLPDWIDRRLGD